VSGIGAAITDLRTNVFRFPTPVHEADGTFEWDATTAVTVQVSAGGRTGLGWSYTSPASAALVRHHLAGVVRGREAGDVPGCWEAMVRACRNLGRDGLVSQAIAAVDIALWDLKARLLGVPLAQLFGRVRDSVPVYGSGGFTSLTDSELRDQVEGWLEAGCAMVKIKVGESWGTRPDRDLARTRLVRGIVGDDVELMVDANGGYDRGEARRLGTAYDDLGVTWFEEPVSSDDLEGLAVVRGALRCDVAAGEYVSSVYGAEALCPVLDCLQLDATRCAGYSGWLRGAAVAASHGLEVSAHCAPALHACVAAAVPNLRHVEWFVDHARLEPLLVDGVPPVRDGRLLLDPDALGHGMTLRADAERWAA
jgi:L-alanine-DL-glutamate epimerase-like enolase superfamily enzyme